MLGKNDGQKRSITRKFRDYCKNSSGNIATFFALSVPFVLIAIGAALDTARVTREYSTFHASVDSAAFAIAQDNRSATTGGTISEANKSALKELAKKYISANYSADKAFKGEVTVSLEVTGEQINLGADLEFPTTLMKLVGIDSVSMTASTTIEKAMKPIEVVLALDTTGSMSAEIPSLKKATYNFLRTLYGLPKNTSSSPVPLTSAELAATVGRREYIRLAIVPFAGAVRLDPNTPNIADWVDMTGANPLSTVNFSNTNLVAGATALNNYTAWSVINKSGGGKHSWNGCVEGRRRSAVDAENYLVNDAPPVSGVTKFPAYFNPDGASFMGNSGNVTFKHWSTGQNVTTKFYDPVWLAATNTTVSASWLSDAPIYGTIAFPQSGGRAVQDNNNYPFAPLPLGYPLTGGTPWKDAQSPYPNVKHTVTLGTTSLGDLTGIGIGTIEQRLTNTNKYFTSRTLGTATTSNSGPWTNCAWSTVVPLTHDPAKINTAIGQLTAYGNTNIMEGAAWGMRVISPSAPFTTVSDVPTDVSDATDTNGAIAAYDDKRWQKIVVLMSDGENNPYSLSNNVPTEYADQGTAYNAYGRSTANVAAGLNRYGTNTFAGLDAVIDADTVKVCSIIKANNVLLYSVGFGVDTDTLKQCATKPSAPYYQYESTADLSTVFNHIAENVLTHMIYASK